MPKPERSAGRPLCRPQLVKGFMQLYSVDQKRSQALEAHAAAFSQLRTPGSDATSTVISFAQKTLANGQLTSKLHVIELGATPGARPLPPPSIARRLVRTCARSAARLAALGSGWFPRRPFQLAKLPVWWRAEAGHLPPS